MKNWLRVTICLLLVVSVLAMSLSVFAVEYDPDYTVTQDDWTNQLILYIWLTMQSWGIDVALDDVVAYGDEVSEWLWVEIQDYLSELPSITTWSQWIFPWKVGIDNWGRLIGNNSFLEDVQDFVDWLVVKFSIASNTEDVVVQGLRYVDDDNGNRYYAGLYNSAFEEISSVVFEVSGLVSTPLNTEKIYFNNGQNYVTYSVVSRADGRNGVGSLGLAWYNLENGNYVNRGSAGLPLSQANNWDTAYVKLFYFPGGYDLSNHYHDEGVYFTYTETKYNSNQVYDGYFWLGNITEVRSDGSIVIITGDLDIPDDINPDDSIVIDGTPQYIEITWPDEIAVSNLPAVVSTGTIENPHLEEAYRPIQGLITYAKNGIGVCTALLYELPDEMVYMWYGLIASIIVWGMIKLMREH